MLLIRPITDDDQTEIEQWPPYPPEFKDLDYALRSGGWLSEYRIKPETGCFAVEADGDLYGFTILSKSGVNEAEFRIALKPDKTGGGIGRHAALLTLEKGFTEFGLDRIHLIVRKNNPRAARVYRALGFSETGECVKIIDGKSVDLILMELTKTSYTKGSV